MDLVEQHGADALQERVALQPLNEDALGDEEDPGVTGEVPLEADLPADLAAEGPTLLVGDPASRRPGRDPPWLEDEDLPAADHPGRHDRWRHPRRLPGPGRRLQHGIAACPQRVQKVGERFVDRQRRQRARHPPMLPVNRDTQTGHTNRPHKQDTRISARLPESARFESKKASSTARTQ